MSNKSYAFFAVLIVNALLVPAAYATATYVPTGAYEPQDQPSQQQHVDVQVGDSAIHASSSGVDINVPGVGSVKADQDGANISFSGFGSMGGGGSNGIGWPFLVVFGLVSLVLLALLVLLIVKIVRSLK